MIERIKKTPDVFYDNPFFIKFAAYCNAFSEYEVLGDFYVQKDENNSYKAFISVIGGQATLFSNGMLKEEIREFLKEIHPFEVFTDKKSAETLKLSIKNTGEVLKTEKTGTVSRTADVSAVCLYNKLNDSFKTIEKQRFCVDVSHLIRHSSAKAVLEDYGAALLYFYNNASFLSAICVDKDMQKRGLGSTLLKEIINMAPVGSIFTVSKSDVVEFYKKNGFYTVDAAAYCEVI